LAAVVKNSLEFLPFALMYNTLAQRAIYLDASHQMNASRTNEMRAEMAKKHYTVNRKHGTTQTSLRSEQKTFRTRRRIGVVVILRQLLFCNKVLGVFCQNPKGWRLACD
jgi:hypothetical protein